MRILLKTSIVILAFCFCVFAQTNEVSPCPTVSVTGPAGIPSPNELINYSVSVDSKGKDLVLEYVWSVSDGEIVEGQGTQNIKIKHPLDGCLTVAVEVKGFPVGCSNLASESMCMDPPPQAVKIDVFSEPFAKINKERINQIIEALQEDYTAQLYIIFRHKEKTSQKTITQKELKVHNSLLKGGLAKDRITIIKDFRQSESVEFWLVPVGATPPTKIKDN